MFTLGLFGRRGRTGASEAAGTAASPLICAMITDKKEDQPLVTAGLLRTPSLPRGPRCPFRTA